MAIRHAHPSAELEWEWLGEGLELAVTGIAMPAGSAAIATEEALVACWRSSH